MLVLLSAHVITKIGIIQQQQIEGRPGNNAPVADIRGLAAARLVQEEQLGDLQHPNGSASIYPSPNVEPALLPRPGLARHCLWLRLFCEHPPRLANCAAGLCLKTSQASTM